MAEIFGNTQMAIVCGICENDQDVSWYCLDCKGNLCAPCHNGHTTKLPIFKSHRVVSIIEGIKKKYLEEECGIHQSNLYTLHCIQCGQLVCPICIIDHHKGHDLEEIQDTMERVSSEIKGFSDTLETEMLQPLQREKAKVAEYIENSKEWLLSVESEVNKQREELKNEIDQACDAHINKAKEENKRNLAWLELENERIDEMEQELNTSIRNSVAVQSKLNTEKIKFNKVKPCLVDLTAPKVSSFQLPVYQNATINRVQIAVQIGNFQIAEHQCEHIAHMEFLQALKSDESSASKVNVVSSHKYAFKIGSMVTAGDDAVWICDHLSKQMKLVNTAGILLKSFDLRHHMSITSFVMAATGDIIWTDYGGMRIRRMTQKGEITYNINTKPYKPSGICLANDKQDVAVCLNSPDKSSSRLVVFAPNGNIKETLKYTDKPVGEHWKQAVILNKRMEYCIAHSGQHKVFVLDNKGSTIYTYHGSSARNREGFTPWGLCCDSKNHLFISDHQNNTVHMLDAKGRFLRHLLTERDGVTMPTDLTIDAEGRLWVGQWDGRLRVVKYLE